MLKTDSLPADQQLRNNTLNRELSRLGIALALLCVLTVGGLIALYLNGGNAGGSDHHVASREGLLLGFAVVMNSDYVVTDSEVPEQVQINMSDHSVVPAHRVRAEPFDESITFSLIRADVAFSPAEVPLLGTAELTERGRVTISGGHWEGSLRAHPPGSYLELDPPITLGPGLPIYQNQTLVAVTAQTGNGVVVAVPISYLLTKFKEISSGR